MASGYYTGHHRYRTFPSLQKALLESSDLDRSKWTGRCCLPACPPESDRSISRTHQVPCGGVYHRVTDGEEPPNSNKSETDAWLPGWMLDVPLPMFEPISGSTVGNQPTCNSTGHGKKGPGLRCQVDPQIQSKSVSGAGLCCWNLAYKCGSKCKVTTKKQTVPTPHFPTTNEKQGLNWSERQFTLHLVLQILHNDSNSQYLKMLAPMEIDRKGSIAFSWGGIEAWGRQGERTAVVTIII